MQETTVRKRISLLQNKICSFQKLFMEISIRLQASQIRDTFKIVFFLLWQLYFATGEKYEISPDITDRLILNPILLSI